jgi:putative flippase GtrA
MYSNMRRELLRFLLVGGFCTLLQYLVLVAGVELLGVDAVVASTVGFLASASVNYLLNRRFTWASNVSHGLAVRRFIIVLAVGLALNVLGMRLLHGYLHWHYVLSQVLTTMVTLSWNFTGHRQWTFATTRAAK